MWEHVKAFSDILTRAPMLPVPDVVRAGEAARLVPGDGGGGERHQVQAHLASYQVQQEDAQGPKTHFKWWVKNI